MPPRLSLSAVRTVAYRPKPAVPRKQFAPCLLQQRAASDKAAPKSATTPVDSDFKGPNQDQLPHVTEEQAALDKVMGEAPPDISQGTPVQEIFKREKDAQKNAPDVLKQEIKNNTPSGTRSYSTSARRPAELVQFQDTQAVGLEYPDAGLGHKFPIPDISTWTRKEHFKHRYDPVVDQVTKMLMRHGKLSQAQRHVAEILDILRTAPSPQGSMLGGGKDLVTSVPRETLSLSPVQYLTAVIDSVAPLVKIKQLKGLLGGGQAMPIPSPLQVKQRRRFAIKWILESAAKRNEVKLSERVAKEIINIAEGRSSAWERRSIMHKLGISARANVRHGTVKKRRRSKI